MEGLYHTMSCCLHARNVGLASEHARFMLLNEPKHMSCAQEHDGSGQAALKQTTRAHTQQISPERIILANCGPAQYVSAQESFRIRLEHLRSAKAAQKCGNRHTTPGTCHDLSGMSNPQFAAAELGGLPKQHPLHSELPFRGLLAAFLLAVG